MERMKTLLLMRHAKSSWKEPGLSDHDRPLNRRGEQAAPRMAKWLEDQALSPDIIICSTALRAKSTAGLVADSLSDDVDAVPFSQLYLSGEESYLEVMRTIDSEIATLLLVGHNPTMEHLTACLTGSSEVFPTGAIAQVECPIESWFQLRLDESNQLVQFCKPRDLD